MKKRTLLKENYGLFFVMPFLVLMVVFRLYPSLHTIYLSTFSGDYFIGMEFSGLDNYKRLFADPVFFKSVFNTILIWVMNIIPRIAIALFFAYILSKNPPPIRGKSFFMAVFYLPNLITAASIGALFAILLDWQTGPLNMWLMEFGIISEHIYWLNSPFWARSFVALIIGWMWFGYATILLVAGMGTISEDLYDCAYIEGANHRQMFSKITLPLIRPILAYIIVVSFIGGMQNFDIPSVLTDGLGSPDRSILTVVMNLYNHSFIYFNMSYGAAISVGLFFLILVISILFFRVTYKKEEE